MTDFAIKDWKDAPEDWTFGDPIPPGATPLSAAAMEELEGRIRVAILDLDSRVDLLEGAATTVDAHAIDTTGVHGFVDTKNIPVVLKESPTTGYPTRPPLAVAVMAIWLGWTDPDVLAQDGDLWYPIPVP